MNTLNSSFSDLRTEGMLALLSLSNLDKARLAMHEAEAIPLLVLQLENDTIKCQECAAKAVSRRA